MQGLFHFEQVGFRYPIAKKPALKNITCDIYEKDFVGILGHNGAGKTTFTYLLRRIIPEHIHGEMRGKVLFEGRDLAEYSTYDLACKIGLVFQNPFLQISGIKKTVFEEVAFGLENLGVPREEITPRVQEVLKQFKIEYLAESDPTRLSGGQCQRVAIAAVFVMNPDVIILDEPTSQLDPLGTEEVFEALGILKSLGKTVVLVEHKIDLISEYANKVMIFHEGRLAASGETAEILSSPEIVEWGVQMPNVTRAALEIQRAKAITLSQIPTTLETAVSVFQQEVL